MNWNFPKTKFVDDNDRDHQFEHVVSEVVEVSNAIALQESAGRIDEELMDLFHSLETYWRIQEKERGPEYVAGMRRYVTDKNAARDYYPAIRGFSALADCIQKDVP